MSGTLRITSLAVPQSLTLGYSEPTPDLALRLLPTAESTIVADEDVQALEVSLLDFNVDDDIEDLVPMPRRIAREVRRALTTAFTDRFDYYADLDVWLHLPHPVLGAESPFERLVAGDGWSVLRALVGPKRGRGALADGSTATCARRSSRRLWLVP